MEHKFVIITSSKTIGQRDRILQGKRVILPTFELFSNPTVKVSDIKSRRFNLIDRYIREAHNQIIIKSNKKIGLWNKINSFSPYIGTIKSKVEQMEQKTKNEIMAQEDDEIFKILDDIDKVEIINK